MMVWTIILIAAKISCMVVVAAAACVEKGEKYKSGNNWDKAAAVQFLQDYDSAVQIVFNEATIISFTYETNITDSNEKLMLASQDELAAFGKEAWQNATSFAWKDFEMTNKTVYRWFKKLSTIGTAALSKEKVTEFNKIVTDMQNIYSTATICPFNSAPGTACNLTLDPELIKILEKSRNSEELKYVWTQWRDVSGKKMKEMYRRYADLSNEAACINGFDDNGDMWRDPYESSTFLEDVEKLWQTVKPLYEQFHAYVRRKLLEFYPNENIKPDGPIPAHLLGNMWAQQWTNIMDILNPFPNKTILDVTETMQEKKMVPIDMFKLAESFYVSIGLRNMTTEFWQRSLIEKPKDRDVVCHPSAWDFYDKKDFRIKMCTTVDMNDLVTIHHEMGHIEYFMAYSDWPVIFRDGANPGFHEAIGDTIALSVATPGHLQKIGLLSEVKDDPDGDILALMTMATDKIAFLPFGYMLDMWRYKVFDGSIAANEMNTKYWELTLKYQGMCPPVRRTENDMDPGSKFHVAADVEYMRYFVSYIVQFQFYKALCDEAGHTGPLHKCDIYQNKNAGTLFSDMLKLGSTVVWEDAMEVITKGKTREMDAGPLMDYFSPLLEWLKNENKDEFIGWKSDDPTICP